MPYSYPISPKTLDRKITNNTSSSSLNFKSSAVTAFYTNGNPYNTTTAFFRSDLDWGILADILHEKYKHISKVNIIDHACSTGEESYSVLVALIAKFGENADKYLPIDARDYNKYNINKAKRGNFLVNEDELNILKYFLKDRFNSCFILSEGDKHRDSIYARDKIAKHIKFSQSNIFDDIETMSGKNTVLFCRNFWAYLTKTEQKELAAKIAKKLDSSSLLVLGSFDTSYGIDKLFEKLGFRHTKDYYIMEKIPKSRWIMNKIIKNLGFTI